MKVVVVRSPGDNPSPDVLVDNLCTSEIVGTAKGKTYLYDNGFDKLIITLKVKHPLDIICGDILEYFDPDYGTINRGRITDWNNQCSIDSEGYAQFDQTLTVEKSIT